jgi:hypothetical protein
MPVDYCTHAPLRRETRNQDRARCTQVREKQRFLEHLSRDWRERTALLDYLGIASRRFILATTFYAGNEAAAPGR